MGYQSGTSVTAEDPMSVCGRRDPPLRNSCLVSVWEATHCKSARALQTRFETWAVRLGGDRRG